jgi:hypothetical protein
MGLGNSEGAQVHQQGWKSKVQAVAAVDRTGTWEKKTKTRMQLIVGPDLGWRAMVAMVGLVDERKKRRTWKKSWRRRTLLFKAARLSRKLEDEGNLTRRWAENEGEVEPLSRGGGRGSGIQQLYSSKITADKRFNSVAPGAKLTRIGVPMGLNCMDCS